MAWPTKAQRAPAPLHDLFPAQPFDQPESSVATLDAEPVAIIEQEQPVPAAEMYEFDIASLAAREAQAQARMQKAQDILQRRAAEQAELDRIEAEEQAEREAAGAELRAVQAQLQAAQDRAEQERKIKVVQEFEASGIMLTLAENAVEAYRFVESQPDATEQARAVFTQMFLCDAPPREAWNLSAGDASFLCEVALLNGQVVCAVDIRAGLDAPSIILYGLSERVPGVRVESAAALGRVLIEYPEAAALFGLADVEPVKPDGYVDISAFGVQA